MDILRMATDYFVKADFDHGLTIPQIADLIQYLDSLGIEGLLLDWSVQCVLRASEPSRKSRRLIQRMAKDEASLASPGSANVTR